MIDKTKVTEAVTEMCENPDWKDVLMNAPGAANLRIALAFYASKNLDSMSQQEKDEYREFREMLESQLNAEELKYLAESFKRMGVDAATSHYQELFSKKTPEEQAQGEKAYQELEKQINGGSSGSAGDSSSNAGAGESAGGENANGNGADTEEQAPGEQSEQGQQVEGESSSVAGSAEEKEG